MATSLSLKLRPCLIWEVKNPAPYRITPSPEFTLYNSIWRFEFDLLSGRNRQTHDTFLRIHLKNLCEVETVNEFEVTTFVEDKVNGSQIKGYKQTISGSCIVYEISIYGLCGKLPKMEINSDMIFTFVFSSPGELGFNIRNEKIEDSKILGARCLVWETRKPDRNQNRSSPVFNLVNTRWKLEAAAANARIAFHSAYHISMRNVCGTRPLPPYTVRLIVDHPDFKIPFSFEKADEASPATEIYKERFDSISPDPDGFEGYYKMTVICIFIEPKDISINTQMTQESEVLLDCSSCRNRGCFTQEYGAGPQDLSVKFSPYIEGLSADMAELMERRLMTDINLKCGEEIIPAHRAILSVRSRVLKDMILRETNENSSGTIVIGDIEAPVLRVLLKYLYTGRLPFVVSEAMICNLYRASSRYAVLSLRKMCSCYLSRNLRERNFIEILRFASMYCDEELKNAVASFIAKNTGLIKNENWVRFARDQPQLAAEIHNKYITKALSR